MKLALACVVAFALSAGAKMAYTDRALTDAATQLVRDKFRDPAGVQFREFVTKRQDFPSRVDIYVEANGRNSFGGYGEFEKFYTRGGRAILATNAPETTQTYISECVFGEAESSVAYWLGLVFR